MENQLVKYEDIERMGTAITKSGLFGVKTPDQAIALMLIAQAEGLHPAIAARDYHIIQGKPSMKTDAMLARFQMAGGKIEWGEYSDTSCSATFFHPAGGKVSVTWTIEMAKRAVLMTNSTWVKYPRQMLRTRVISEGIRSVYPGSIVGMYTPEEVEDMSPERAVTETSATVVSSSIVSKKPERETEKAIRKHKERAAADAIMVSDPDPAAAPVKQEPPQPQQTAPVNTPVDLF